MVSASSYLSHTVATAREEEKEIVADPLLGDKDSKEEPSRRHMADDELRITNE
jgi:hypothetical protein